MRINSKSANPAEDNGEFEVIYNDKFCDEVQQELTNELKKVDDVDNIEPVKKIVKERIIKEKVNIEVDDNIDKLIDKIYSVDKTAIKKTLKTYKTQMKV